VFNSNAVIATLHLWSLAILIFVCQEKSGSRNAWPKLRPYDLSAFTEELETSQRSFLFACICDLVNVAPFAPGQPVRQLSASTKRGLSCLTRTVAPQSEVLDLLRESAVPDDDKKCDVTSSTPLKEKVDNLNLRHCNSEFICM
jgi:hypothetical protein